MASKSQFHYEPSHLERDELEYDLSVRNIVGLSTRRAETAALRAHLQKEFEGYEGPPVRNPRDMILEIQCALHALSSIKNTVKAVTPNSKAYTYDYAKSRMAHWLNRLGSIESSSSELLELIDKFKTELEIIEVGNNDLLNVQETTGGLNVTTNISQGFSDSGALRKNFNSDVNLFGRSSLPALPNQGKGRGRGLSTQRSQFNLNHDRNFGRSDPLRNRDNVELQRNEKTSGFSNNNDNGLNNSGNGSVVCDVDELFSRLNVNNNYRPLRMFRWNATFSGDGQGLSLNEFLTRIGTYAKGENVTEDQLFANIHQLLKGKAEHWYWGNINEIGTWREFVVAIRGEFLPQNYDFFLREEIQNRIQHQHESFSSFITDMKVLFQRVDPPLDENYKLYIVRRNMLSDYSVFLATMNIRTLNDLIGVCKNLDESRLMAERRNMSQAFSGMSLVEPSCFPKPGLRETTRRVQFRPHVSVIDNNSQYDFGNNSNLNINSNFYKQHVAQQSSSHLPNDNASYQHSNYNQVSGSNSSRDLFSQGYDFQNSNFNNNHPHQNSQIYSQFSHDVSEINQALPVQQHRRPNHDLICFNCKQNGHTHFECSVPRRRVFCFTCGADGVRASNCPNCVNRKKKLANNFSKNSNPHSHSNNSESYNQNSSNFNRNQGNSQAGGR